MPPVNTVHMPPVNTVHGTMRMHVHASTKVMHGHAAPSLLALLLLGLLLSCTRLSACT